MDDELAWQYVVMQQPTEETRTTGSELASRDAGGRRENSRDFLRRVVVQVGLALALFVSLAPSWAQSVSPSDTLLLPPATTESERRVREAIAQGIAYLERQQVPGSGRIGARYPVATTSLAGMAVLGAGIHPGRAPYDRMLEGCVRYLLQSADADGYISESDRGRRTDSGSRMHGHCYAVLFLTQIVGSLPLETEKKVRTAIQQGVRVIERSQSREGGWWYTSKNESDRDEASVTVCAVQSLRAARNTGFVIDPRVIRDGIRYVVRCQTSSGAFRYSLSERQRRSSFALTAAAVSTLNAAGIYEAAGMGKPTEALRRGLDHLHRSVVSRPKDPERIVKDQFFYYGNLYAAQALFQEGEASWKSWYARVSENLLRPDLRRREGDAAWWRTPEGESPYGKEYATAVALLILEIPLGYLPIFQR